MSGRVSRAQFVEIASDTLAQRLRRQVEWLCGELNQINSGSDEMCHCPDLELRFAPKPMDCHPEGCAMCWEQASLSTVGEDASDQA